MRSPQPPSRSDFTFTSRGATCAAWHVEAASEALAGPAGRPCVVMAHGFSATRDTGLLRFAERLAAAGIDVLVFDYRGFGDSGGEPRQVVSVRRQRQDLHAALVAARGLSGIDPDRVALWGYSYGGGHAVAVAAKERRVAAVVAMNPATDGCATLVQLVRGGSVGLLLRLTAHGLLDAATGHPNPHVVPVVGKPGETAMITASGAEGFADNAGPTWRNEVGARAALAVATNRPTIWAKRLTCPMLIQVGTNDAVAPPTAARRTAKRAGQLADLREYQIDHFQAFDEQWRDTVLADQLDFLVHTLA